VDEALQALNRIAADGVIGGYAIGGAVGASFYISAAQTEDLDAFVSSVERFRAGFAVADRCSAH
jgi:hypothetical protein